MPVEVGALLRREGLYSSHLTHWRKEVEASEQAALDALELEPAPAGTQALLTEMLESAEACCQAVAGRPDQQEITAQRAAGWVMTLRLQRGHKDEGLG